MSSLLNLRGITSRDAVFDEGRPQALKMSARSFVSANARAVEILHRKDKKISFQDMTYVLEALPQPKNTRRVGVIPDDQNFVHSQSAGLTTQKGLKPTLSSLCLSAPNVVRCLSKFVLDFDPTFKFTTITLNYNYSSAPHRDINHEDGKARIIALGNFTGGELILGVKVGIREKWFDFDGTILHSTAPFKGERYSLVYFIHDVWKREEAVPIGLKLINLGVSWPCQGLRDDQISTCFSRKSSNAYFALSNKFFPNNNAFIVAEMRCLSQKTATILNLGNASRNNFTSSAFACYKLSSIEESRADHIASRCVSFQLFEELYAGDTIDELASAYINGGIFIPTDKSYGMDIIAGGLAGTRKLSTRQRRKISSQLGIPRSNFVNNEEVRNFSKDYYVLLLLHSSKQELISVHLLKHIFHKKNTLTSEICKTKKINKSKLPTTGTTPLKPALAKIMSNLCEVKPSSLCLDPFVGSGSLFQNCHSLLNIGIDASSSRLGCFDDCVKKKENIIGNIFQGYFRAGEIFDCIICDPPYGRREKHIDSHGNDGARHQSNEERALAQFKILTPLFQLASSTLRENGKMVFGFFNYPGNENCAWGIEDLPKHGNLKVEHVCREEWKYTSGHVLCRDIVVVRKIDF